MWNKHTARGLTAATLAALAAAAAALAAAPAGASETIAYSYDARGRLIQVAHSGTINNGVTASYAYDKADNRTNVTVATGGGGGGGGGGGAGPSFSVGDASANEGGSLDFTVTKSGAATGTVTVDYATANGSATAGSDYTAKSGTLSFLTGDTSKTVSVPTIDDSAVESSETVLLNLSNATSGATIADGQGVGTIADSAPANHAPVAQNDNGAQQTCSTGIYNVTANDSDPDGDPLTVTAVTGAGFSVYSPSQIQFVSTQITGGRVGTYTVQDSHGATDTATLTVTVSAGGPCQ